MQSTFHIHGMTCQGCRRHVEDALSKVRGVTKATVSLEKTEAVVEMESHIPLEIFQESLQSSGGQYSIHKYGTSHRLSLTNENNRNKVKGSDTFYCPMHCEADKTYKKVGSCPVCGMDLVPMMEEPSRENGTYERLLKKFWIATAFTLPIFVVAMSEMLSNNPLHHLMTQKYWNWVQLTLSIPVVFYAAWMFFERAYQSIKTWRLNMFTLIGIGAGVAWLFSFIGLIFPAIFPSQFKTGSGAVHVYFEAATMILTLVLLGQLLEARAHNRTNAAIRKLLELTPNVALKIIDGQEVEVSIDAIEVNDILKVKPGGKIPVDGIIIEGDTTVDESMITGEPIPADKSKNDIVNSGTMNGNQSFLMKAQKVGADTLLSQIINMVNDASRSRAPIQNLVDKVARFFVPGVLVVSIITFIVWSLWGPQPAYVYALVNAIAVLIIACPCALGLATPMSIMVGVGKGAQHGVLIKSAESLQKMAKVDILILDKTGTITEGKPTVESVGSFQNNFSASEILQYIASLNINSEHPLAEATIEYSKEQKIEIIDSQGLRTIVGKGVCATIQDKIVALGNAKMMEHVEALITPSMLEKAQSHQVQGKTVSFLSIDGLVCGYVVIADKIKESSAKAIEELQNKGIDVIMLTGDNRDTAQAVAKELNLRSFKAGMLPEDKLKEVKHLQEKAYVVAMAGDGINDSPALAKSDVGIAMGTGTDIAIESAMITLVKGDLNGILKARNLSHAVMKNIKQNLFFAIIYNTLGVPIAAGVLFPAFGILLSPMIAALAMSFSSVSVIGNALRLRNLYI